jgi:transcriptional regulator with XRE-family HTH domain
VYTFALMGIDFAKMRELREGKGLTQEQAAQLSGMPGRQRWNDIENGRHTNLTLETLEKIATALGVKSKDLLK